MRTHVDPKRLEKRERGDRLKSFLNRVYLIIILGILVWFGYFIFLGTTFEIKQVSVVDSGGGEINQDITKAVDDFLDERRYYILPQKSYFIIDTEALESSIKNSFFVSDIRITKKLPNNLLIRYKERASSFTLCMKEKCYKVNHTGDVGGRNEDEDLDGGLPWVYYELEGLRGQEKAEGAIGQEGEEGNEEWGSVEESEPFDIIEEEFPKIVPGLSQISEEKVGIILDLFEVMEKRGRGVEVLSMSIYDFGGLKRKIAINTKQGFKVFFDEIGDLEEQVDNLNIFVNNNRSKLDALEYVDLRFDKVYYK